MHSHMSKASTFSTCGRMRGWTPGVILWAVPPNHFGVVCHCSDKYRRMLRGVGCVCAPGGTCAQDATDQGSKASVPHFELCGVGRLHFSILQYQWEYALLGKTRNTSGP